MGVDEPYRMFTSRAEYRLILREDNATQRLCPLAKSLGLLSSEQIAQFEKRQTAYERASHWLEKTRVKPTVETNTWLESKGTATLKDSVTLTQLLKRPQITLRDIFELCPYEESLTDELCAALEIEWKFSGYLNRQEEEVERLKKIEGERIPADFPYEAIKQLRTEAREKLKKHRPDSLGQAMRIPGMTPSTISLLAVYLKRYRSAAGMAQDGGKPCEDSAA
jgi:tRNA uridine 5-carboxymethylaminomethyl modification enzyme